MRRVRPFVFLSRREGRASFLVTKGQSCQYNAPRYNALVTLARFTSMGLFLVTAKYASNYGNLVMCVLFFPTWFLQGKGSVGNTEQKKFMIRVSGKWQDFLWLGSLRLPQS